MEHSGEDFTYIDPVTNERYVPYCIEPSLGADRVTLAFLCDSYEEEQLEGDDTRTVLRFHPALAPFKAAVLPLSKKLSEEAGDVWADLRKSFPVDFDESQSIGKRFTDTKPLIFRLYTYRPQVQDGQYISVLSDFGFTAYNVPYDFVVYRCDKAQF